MRKNFFLGAMALAAVALTGCQKDEVLNQVPQDNAIEFGTYVGRDAQTKAYVIDNDQLAKDGFGVFAYYTGKSNFSTSDTPNFMYNQRVDKGINGENANWIYSPIKYWPNNENDKLSFFAYAPHVTNTNEYMKVSVPTTESTLTPEITYTVNDDVANHQDILWAIPVLNASQSSIKVNDEIKFNFKHTLSRIGFKVQALVDRVNYNQDGSENNDTNNGSDLDAATTIRIKSVTLSGNFYAQGKLVYAATPENKFKWEDLKTAEANKISFVLKNSDEDNKYGNFTKNADNVTDATSGITQQLNNENSYLMIIPQGFTSTSKLTINVIYTVTTVDDKLPGGKSEIENNITTSFNMQQPFKAGEAYNFVLHLGLRSVKLTADVAEWDESDIAVNLPIIAEK